MSAVNAVDWSTISSLVTGAGTLVLAVATFAAVRSSNRSARIAEAALQEQRRPLLATSRFDDPGQKIMFGEGRWVQVEGGRAGVEVDGGTVYLVLSLRNIGSGVAVCQGWAVRAGRVTPMAQPDHMPLEQFRLQQRDLYVPAGDIGMWQGALRDSGDPHRAEVAEAVAGGQPITIELIYSDQVGGQRTISRFGLLRPGDQWVANLSRLWPLDWQGPRPQHLVEAALAAAGSDLQPAGEPTAASSRPGEKRPGGEAPPDPSAVLRDVPGRS